LLPEHLDASVAPGEEWCYEVRFAVALEPLAESAAPPEACIAVKDIAPPAAPLGLAVLVRSDAIELSWTAVSAPDLAGYRVFRADAPGVEPRLVGELAAGETVFRDRQTAAGVLYVYFVSAVDAAGNESPRSDGIEVRP
jgi:hypothetical protein